MSCFLDGFLRHFLHQLFLLLLEAAMWTATRSYWNNCPMFWPAIKYSCCFLFDYTIFISSKFLRLILDVSSSGLTALQRYVFSPKKHMIILNDSLLEGIYSFKWTFLEQNVQAPWQTIYMLEVFKLISEQQPISWTSSNINQSKATAR